MRGLLAFDGGGGSLTLKAVGKEPSGGTGKLPVGEGAILNWVKGQGGVAIISSDHGTSVAKVGDKFTESIETENRNRFFRHNLGYVLAGLAMTAAVVIGVITFGGLQDQDISILAAALCWVFWRFKPCRFFSRGSNSTR